MPTRAVLGIAHAMGKVNDQTMTAYMHSAEFRAEVLHLAEAIAAFAASLADQAIERERHQAALIQKIAGRDASEKQEGGDGK